MKVYVCGHRHSDGIHTQHKTRRFQLGSEGGKIVSAKMEYDGLDVTLSNRVELGSSTCATVWCGLARG